MKREREERERGKEEGGEPEKSEQKGEENIKLKMHSKPILHEERH